MTRLLTPDLCVIGAGAGGLSVAAGAAALGAPTVLVEKGAMGGECLNSGCVPSKALIAAAEAAAAMRGAARGAWIEGALESMRTPSAKAAANPPLMISLPAIRLPPWRRPVRCGRPAPPRLWR